MRFERAARSPLIVLLGIVCVVRAQGVLFRLPFIHRE